MKMILTDDNGIVLDEWTLEDNLGIFDAVQREIEIGPTADLLKDAIANIINSWE